MDTDEGDQIGEMNLATICWVNALRFIARWYQCPSVNISGSTAFLGLNTYAGISSSPPDDSPFLAFQNNMSADSSRAVFLGYASQDARAPRAVLGLGFAVSAGSRPRAGRGGVLSSDNLPSVARPMEGMQ
jgi:hypothetical protein